MHLNYHFGEKHYQFKMESPIDISIPLRDGMANPNCFHAPPVDFSPVRFGEFVGDTQEGGAVNFKNVRFNPHGNGTHTECVGHIAKEKFTIRECLQRYHFLAKLISVFPRRLENGDRVIEKGQLEEWLQKDEMEALIIRTLPNDDLKCRTNYSSANPPYLTEAAVQYIVDCGIEHLLVDLPSIDREEDGGALLGHKAFWQYPSAIRRKATISELIYVPNAVKDDLYLLNLQTASFDLDVSPSKPVLYQIL